MNKTAQYEVIKCLVKLYHNSAYFEFKDFDELLKFILIDGDNKEDSEDSTYCANSTNSTINEVIPEKQEIPESEITDSEQTASEKLKSYTNVSEMGQQRTYTPEVVEFLKKKYQKSSVKSLVKLLKSKFDIETDHVRLKGVLEYWGITKYKRNTSKRNFPPEMETFIKENVETMSNPELAQETSKKFGVDLSKKSLIDFMNYRKIKRSKRIVSSKPIKKPSTEVEPKVEIKGPDRKIIQFIKNNSYLSTDNQMRQALSEEFGRVFSIDQVKEFRKKLHPKTSAWLDKGKHLPKEEEEWD